MKKTTKTVAKKSATKKTSTKPATKTVKGRGPYAGVTLVPVGKTNPRRKGTQSFEAYAIIWGHPSGIAFDEFAKLAKDAGKIPAAAHVAYGVDKGLIKLK